MDVSASDTREVEVIVDPAKLVSAGLTVKDVTAALNGNNVLQPVGHYPSTGTQHLVIASGLWESAEQISATPIVGAEGTMLTVGDVARVVAGAPDRTSLVAGTGVTGLLAGRLEVPGSTSLSVTSRMYIRPLGQ